MHHSDDLDEQCDMETSNQHLQVQMYEYQIEPDYGQLDDSEYRTLRQPRPQYYFFTEEHLIILNISKLSGCLQQYIIVGKTLTRCIVFLFFIKVL